MKKTIETKIAKNGVKLYYVDGKRTSREVALQAAADNRENLFTIEYPIPRDPYFMGRILIAGANVYESTSKAVLKELELKIDEYHGFTVKLHTIGYVDICKLFNKDYAKSLINKIENAFIRGEYGVKIDKYGKVSILPAPVIEPNPDDYAINPDALEVAVNAEIKNANTAKINDLKWEIRYTEGSINDLDQNHIAHAPNDQSLQERRAELVNELAALNSQLADLLPDKVQNANNEQNDEAIEAEFTAAQNEVHRLQDEMKSLIGTPDYFVTKNEYHAAWQRYEIALAKAQQASRRRMAALLNNEPDIKQVAELSDQEIAEIKRRSQINAIKSRIATYERAIERQYDAELENSLLAAKAQLAEIEPANTHEADHITGIMHQRGNREKLLALRKDYIITDRLSY